MAALDPFRKKIPGIGSAPRRNTPVNSINQTRLSAAGRNVVGQSADRSNIYGRSPSNANLPSPSPVSQYSSQQLQNVQQQKQDVTSIMHEQKMKENKTYQDIEKKRLHYINRLSLAERLGLVDKPPLPLSQAEW